MNKKGFTLIELLASLAILSIIMIVAVPNVVSMLDKNKKDILVSDAKRLASLAESELRNNESIDCAYGGFIVFTYAYLDDGSFEKDPDNKSYNASKSFVVVHKKGTASGYQFDYYVQLIGSKRGADLTLVRGLTQKDVKDNFQANAPAAAIAKAVGVSSPSIVTY